MVCAGARGALPPDATRLEIPMKSILDPSFRYVPSHATDLRKTFARARRRARDDSAKPAAKPDNIVSLPPLRKPAA
jgi:hypothetical protein